MKYKKLHPWNVSPKEAIKIQEKLRRRVILKRGFKKIRIVAGADVAFSEKEAFGAVVVLSYPELEKLEEAFHPATG